MPKIIDNYTNERNELLQKIYNILDINDYNKMFSLKKLDEDTHIQQFILDLEHDIKKYFLCSRWTFFSNKKRKCKRNYLSLIKAIFKDMNVNMISLTNKIKSDDNKIISEIYFIIK